MAQELDAKLWSYLPTEILHEHVLRWLPFSVLCRFRAVCKFWNTMPAVRPEEPYLLDIPCDSPHVDQLRLCYLYSPVTNIWSHIDLSFVAATMSQLCYPLSWTPQIKTYCSDGGLLCMWGKLLEPRARRASIRHYNLLVCNPLTKSCKVLPQITDWQHERENPMDLVMHKESSGGYKIFAASSTVTRDLHMTKTRYFMYDSISNSWKLLLALNPSPLNSHIFCSIIFNGVFYSCLRDGWDDWNYSSERQYDLFTYDIKDPRMSSIMKFKPHPKASGLSFVVGNGHLLLIMGEGSFFSINKVDLQSDSTTILDASACYVSRPKPFTWISGATFNYGNSIVFTSDDDGSPRVAVHLLSWSADLKEVKPISPVANRPRLGYRWRYYRKNMKKVNFDMEATI